MTVHDLSGIGRSSLSAVISVLSTLGVQTCALPTALLSTDTSQFRDFSFLSLSEEMHKIIAHWKTLDLKFDAIYSGFLGSAEQVAIVGSCLDTFADKDTLAVIDPVLGDNGELYPTMTADMVLGMRRLVSRADVITPNFTEAALLLDEPCRSEFDLATARDWLRRLGALGPKVVLITSAVLEGDAHGSYVLIYDNSTPGREFFWRVSCEYIPADFPGTGDIFTSVLTGSLLRKEDLTIACARAMRFVATGIRESLRMGAPSREGIVLEAVLNSLHGPLSDTHCELLP
jgi:pyridoxine kinase